jgi:primosomal protein N' (replication factor Y)
VSAALWRVLPDVPAVDRAFDYWAPPDTDAPVGTIVRVPLHGRRVRGWLLETRNEPAVAPEQVLAVRAVISEGPPPDVVALCEWAAWRWAGPRAALLRAASPPNLVAPGATPAEPDVAVHPPADPPVALPTRPRRLVVWPPSRPRATLVVSLLAPQGSTIVVAPDSAERAELAAAIAATGRPVVLMRGDDPARARTQAWRAARRGACVVLGGRVAALAPVPDLAAVIVLDDADEALIEERSPTWHARDLLLERARRADVGCTVVTPAPTVDALVACGPATRFDGPTARTGWPIVEIADRRADPPGLGLLGEQLAAALHSALDTNGRAVCVLNRRGGARLLICRPCGEPARCEHCGVAVFETDGVLVCPVGHGTRPLVCAACGANDLRAARPGVRRLGNDVAALVPRATVHVVESGDQTDPDADVVVGTEAALHRPEPEGPTGRRPVRLVAFVDFDQELLAPRFRAAEQALWLLVRGARLVGDRRASGRVLVQTRVPDHDVLRAATTGDPIPLAETEAARRAALAQPPFGGLALVTGATPAVAVATEALRAHLQVLGPVDDRALVRAPSAAALADGLAAVDLSAARAQGRLRIEVDPQRA